MGNFFPIPVFHPSGSQEYAPGDRVGIQVVVGFRSKNRG